MAAYGVGPAGVSTITPPARHTMTCIGRIDVADGSTGFQAFGIPKGAVIGGVYTLSRGANTTQTITAGFTASGTEILTAFAPNSTGYAASGAATGASVGTQLDQDRIVFLKASATLTNPVYVKVEYWMPPQGVAF